MTKQICGGLESAMKGRAIMGDLFVENLLLRISAALRGPVAAVLTLFLITHAATAQSLTASLSPPAPVVVTAETAVDEALRNNLTLLAERLNLSVADAEMITARLRPN